MISVDKSGNSFLVTITGKALKTLTEKSALNIEPHGEICAEDIEIIQDGAAEEIIRHAIARELGVDPDDLDSAGQGPPQASKPDSDDEIPF